MSVPGPYLTSSLAKQACSRWLMNRKSESTSSQRLSPASPHGSTADSDRSTARHPFIG
jgi:hypothetical protein